MILLNLLVFLATAEGGRVELDGMVRFGAKVGPLVADLGQLSRLMTANVLHRDWVHLGLNMFVLIQVGGALENTYRALDYVWLLVFSGVSTMATSLLLNDAVTIGASGMVFGCLGGLLAFGLRYKSALPTRYRRILGDAAIPTVLGLLFIGVTSKGVDNWAHFGGLLAGVVTGLFTRPALLTDRPTGRWQPAWRALPTIGVLAALWLGPRALEGVLPVMRVEHDDEHGLTMPVPRGWKRGANPMGTLAWYNGLPEAGRASVAGEAIEAPEGADARAEAARFLAERLTARALGPGVLSLKAQPPEPGRIGERDAVQVSALITKPGGVERLKAWFIPRGGVVFMLVFLWPEGYARYGAIADEMAAGVRFVEPRAVRLARGEALFFPNSPGAMARLGLALAEEGDRRAAIEALQLAVRAAPDVVPWRVSLSRALLDEGDVEAACRSAQDALAYDAFAPGALEADARCELSRGNARRALERLEEAQAAAPGDERLRAAATKLRASLADFK